MSQMCPNCSFDNPTEAKTCTQCGTPLRNLLGADAVLSERYKLLSVLGCGAMGAVYLAEDQRLKGRRCALKENLPDPNAPVNVQEQSREQFLAEASILARLDHPNLPKVSDYFIEEGREYLVMDYVEGEDLESRMERSQAPLPEGDVLGWADQVLDALIYLHNQKPQPIIHRDIKPANLRIDLYNRVKLVDFGLVKLFDADSPETKAEMRGIGTPAYAPLEQFAGSDEHTDARSDLYSLGATLYHLLTHTPPAEVHRQLLKSDSLIAPRDLNPNINENSEAVILKAMSIYPDERYNTAREMRSALLQTEQATVPSAAPPVKAKAPKKAEKSSLSPVLIGLIGLLIVALLLGVAGLMLFQSPDGAAPPDTPVGGQVTVQATQEDQAALTDAPTPTVGPPTATQTPVVVTATPGPATATPTPPEPTATPSPSATSPPAAVAQPQGIPPESLTGVIAYPVFNGESYDLYFGQADGSGTSFFRSEASQPAFSPDGSRIAFHSWSLSQRGLVAVNVAGGNGTLLTNFIEDQLPTFTADGSQVVFLTRRTGDRRSELLQVDSFTEMDEPEFVGQGEYPTVGADGQLYFRGWGSSGVGLRQGTLDFENITVLTDSERDTAPAPSPDGSQIAFMSDRSGNWEIYLVDADGDNLRRLTDNPARDGLPVWSPDGRAIAFASDRDGQWAIWAISPEGDDLQQLFEMQGSPDGFVGTDVNASRGWAEERLSWTR